MKSRTRKKRIKNPSKAELKKQIAALERLNSKILAECELKIKRANQSAAAYEEARKEAEEYKEAAARAISVLRDFAPELRIFRKDRPVNRIPDFMRESGIVETPPPRVRPELFERASLSLECKTLRGMTHYVRELEISIEIDRPDRTYAFVFSDKPVGHGQQFPGIGAKYFISDYIIRTAPDTQLRYVFQDLVENIWVQFRNEIEKRKFGGAR
jgi:hypothetical protein